MRVLAATDDDLRMITDWLSQPEIAEWLDFGPGTPERPNPIMLKLAAKRGTDLLLTFTPEGEDAKIGVVGLSDIHRHFRTATLWYALGDPRYAGRGLTTRAVATALRIGFGELRLGAIYAWAVADNRASVRVLEKAGFTLVGRRRRCHYVGGEPRDRLLFDILQCEFSVFGDETKRN